MDDKEHNAERPREKITARQAVREILSWVRWIAGAVVLALIMSNFIIVNAKVISGSMEDTIMTGDMVLGSRLAYMLSDPQRFDVIVFRWPDDREDLPYVKRIIGLPGETVEIADGRVYINGSAEPLDEAGYLREEMYTGERQVYVVPEDSYFVLGDNRNFSNDSRAWIHKYVPRGDILGKVILRYYPHMGIVR